MKVMSVETAEGTRSESQNGTTARPASQHIYFPLIALAAFGLYWSSSLLLEARNGTTHFGADTWFYGELAKGNVFDRIADNYYLDRIFRFHPTTVVMAAGWMKIVAPLTPWIAPQYLFKAMFAAVGAVGVWAAMWAFAAVVPRRYATLWGAIYATSLGVWYFSSIEESKVVTATLTALYIATYLHLRQRWTTHGAVLLTAILLLACLNETVAGFLLIIPIVDTLVQRGWDLRHGRWIALHGLAGPVALAILEGLMRGRTGAAGAHPEGANHFSMLIWYMSQNDYSPAGIYSFLVNWFFFNIAAPSLDASNAPSADPDDKEFFDAALTNYFSSPVSASLVVLFAAMLLAILLPRYRTESAGNVASILLALLAYALVRGAFFLVFIPGEPLLFSPAVTLAHMLMIGILFMASSFPAKHVLLAGLAVLLFITNGAFVIGR